MNRRWLSLLLALVMLVTVLPTNAQAEECITIQEKQSAENAGNLSNMGALPEKITSVTYVDVPRTLNAWFDGSVSEKEAASQIREAMVDRDTTITVFFHSQNSDYESATRAVFYNAFEHTGNPKEGDYLRWHYGGYESDISYGSDGITYYYSVTYTVSYYTTAAQEKALDSAVDSLLESLDLNGKNDYEKFSSIYEYICANIVYDNANLHNEAYTLKHSAYAALINKTAVCQGYANLLYRLMLEVGIDCRLIAGTGNGGAHGWNIIKLGDHYYNVDATWDATWYTATKKYNYRLQCEDNFDGHVRDAEYETTDFHTAYPMGSSDYVYNPHNLTRIAAVPATCTTAGNSAYWTCSDCGKYFADAGTAEEIRRDSWIIPAGHSLEAVAYKAPTTNATGNKAHYKCSACGNLYWDVAGQELTTEAEVTLAEVSPSNVRGDADGDGCVDAYDASLIKKYSVGAITVEDLNLSVLDLDGDKYVDAYDASLIQKYSVGAIDRFPVEN